MTKFAVLALLSLVVLPCSAIRLDSVRAKKFEVDSEPSVCIIARTPHQLSPSASARVVAFLASVAAQTYSTWELYLINPMGGESLFEKEVNLFNDVRMHSGPNNPIAYDRNSWGYEATNYALDYLLNQSIDSRIEEKQPRKMFDSEQSCDYFLFTNADNLYHAEFLETLYPGMREHLDLLGVTFTSHHLRESQTEAKTKKKNLMMRDASFKRGFVDLGAVVASKEAILATGARFFDGGFNEQQFKKQQFDADWFFFDRLLQREHSRGHKYYEEVLFFHQ